MYVTGKSFERFNRFNETATVSQSKSRMVKAERPFVIFTAARIHRGHTTQRSHTRNIERRTLESSLLQPSLPSNGISSQGLAPSGRFVAPRMQRLEDNRPPLFQHTLDTQKLILPFDSLTLAGG
jgi:hypothetical protein